MVAGHASSARCSAFVAAHTIMVHVLFALLHNIYIHYWEKIV